MKSWSQPVDYLKWNIYKKRVKLYTHYMYVCVQDAFLYMGVNSKSQNSFADFELQLKLQPKRYFYTHFHNGDILSSAYNLCLSKCWS